jgi:Phosphotransferase enzyme family
MAPAARPETELERVLADSLGGRVAWLSRRPFPYHSSFPIHELTVVLDDGTVEELLLKDLSPSALLPDARIAKPSFLQEPRREIAVYQMLLSSAALGTPAYRGAVVDPDAGTYWLCVERVAGAPLTEVGDPAAWRAVAGWAGRLHRLFLDRTPLIAEAVPLARHDEAFYLRWIRRAVTSVERGEASVPARRAFRHLAGRYRHVVDRLVELPATFIHGEFYASNILVGQNADGLRVCPVDWEMAAVGAGLEDLAALMAGRWSEAERTEMAQTYRRAAGDGICPGDQPEFMAAVAYCRLHVAVQWLGWAPGWTPPPEHVHHWLAEALDLTDRLSL